MTTTVSAPVVDWQGWLDRWEAQQAAYMPDREERFSVMIGALAALCGEAPHIVDLGSGPGSLARRVLDRLPAAQVTAIDMDPVLLAIGRNALGDHGGRLQWLDADLRSRWRPEDGQQVDAAVSTTALHWLQSDTLAALYRHLGTVLQPGGVFIDGDRLGFPPESPRIAAAVDDMRDQRELAPPPSGAESWEEWWAAVEQEPGLADQLAERRRRRHDHPEHEHQADIAVHVQALREAGFSEVETIWQKLSDRVLVALR